MNKSLRTLLAGIVLAVSCSSLQAQSWPERPVTVVVPFAVGGVTDLLGRLFAERLGRELHVTMVVENAAGAGGTIGASRVARARNDGYTVLFHNLAHSTAPALYDKLNYDPIADFEPIGLVGHLPMMVVARPDFPSKGVAELVDYLKTNEKQIMIAHAGVGSSTHLCAVMLGKAIGITPNLVAYKGAGPALMDLVGGQVDLMCDSPGSSSPYVTTGRLRGYAVSGSRRVAAFASIPTFEEEGVKGMDLSLWHGFYVPKGTPQAVVDKLSAALRAALRDPAMVDRMAQVGIEAEQPENGRPEPLRARLAEEIERWIRLLRNPSAG